MKYLTALILTTLILLYIGTSIISLGLLWDKDYRFEVWLCREYPTVCYESQSRKAYTNTKIGDTVVSFMPIIGSVVALIEADTDIYGGIPYQPRLRYRGFDPEDFKFVQEPEPKHEIRLHDDPIPIPILDPR